MHSTVKALVRVARDYCSTKAAIALVGSRSETLAATPHGIVPVGIVVHHMHPLCVRL